LPTPSDRHPAAATGSQSRPLDNVSDQSSETSLAGARSGKESSALGSSVSKSEGGVAFQKLGEQGCPDPWTAGQKSSSGIPPVNLPRFASSPYPHAGNPGGKACLICLERFGGSGWGVMEGVRWSLEILRKQSKDRLSGILSISECELQVEKMSPREVNSCNGPGW